MSDTLLELWFKDRAELIAENADLRSKLEEFLDLCPRMNEDDPIAPALAEACRNARATIAQGKGEK